MPWRTNSTEDEEAVERHAAFRIGAFSEPVYKTGDWPKIMTDTLPPEILPRFTEEEKKDLLGSSLPLLPPETTIAVLKLLVQARLIFMQLMRIAHPG